VTSSTALWYASRATGVVALVLLTVVVLLGILVNRQGRLPGLPRFAVTGLHRSISLLAVAFLAVHVLTAVADPYVTIRLIAAVVPFTSGYEPFAIGLGAVSLDLIAALIVTSLLRAHLGRRLWRAVHWLAYASYPVALLHSVTSAKDLRSGGLLALTAACALAVAAATCYRAAAARSARRPASPLAPPDPAFPERLPPNARPPRSPPAAQSPAPPAGSPRWRANARPSRTEYPDDRHRPPQPQPRQRPGRGAHRPRPRHPDDSRRPPRRRPGQRPGRGARRRRPRAAERTGPMTGTATLPSSWPAAAAAPGAHRLLPPAGQEPGADLAAHARAHGPLPRARRGRALIEEIRSAGLTGRGGAAFPVAVKMTAVAAGRGRPVVVGNGAEGEPASHKDKHLLWVSPHLVLDGLLLAARAVGARRAYLYAHRGDRLHRRLAEALAQRSAAGWDAIAVTLVAAPPRFLAGEESALASRVAGGPARPTFKHPRVVERGVGGAPTLVQNVETLGHVALIARHGAAWFRQAGTAAEPGTMLVTAHRADGASRVSEVPLSTPLASVLELGREPAQAVLAGGYHGAWIPAAQAAALPLANAALRPAGASLGAGVLAALPPGRCGLAETARVLRYLAAESAGQCGPCLNGLPRIAAAFTELAGPAPGPRCLPDLERWSGLVTGRGACHHPDGTVRLVASALRVFRGEIDAHLHGRCPAAAVRGGAALASFLPVPAVTPLSPQDWR